MNGQGENFRTGVRRFISTASISLTFAIVLLSAESIALPTNPDPLMWGADDGTTVFGHSNPVIAFELLDPLSDSPPHLPTFFGFYFDGAVPFNGGVIFDNDDAVGDAAIIDFTGPVGVVSDFELGAGATQGTFDNVNTGTGDIGFFLNLIFPDGTVASFFTDPALNGGFDLAATFPLLSDPTQYLIAFDVPAGAGAFTLAYHARIGGLAAVPEPGTAALIGIALLLLFGRKRAINIRA